MYRQEGKRRWFQVWPASTYACRAPFMWVSCMQRECLFRYSPAACTSEDAHTLQTTHGPLVGCVPEVVDPSPNCSRKEKHVWSVLDFPLCIFNCTHIYKLLYLTLWSIAAYRKLVPSDYVGIRICCRKCMGYASNMKVCLSFSILNGF